MIGGARRTAVRLIVSRAALILVGVLASKLLVSGLTVQKRNLVYHAPAPAALEIWARWDSEWYLMIAERGYRATEPLEVGAGSRPVYRATDAAGFFPLYPLLLRGLALLGIPSLLAGVLVSNLALLWALVALRDLVAQDHGEEAAEAVVWVVLAWPTSFFLSAVYAESLMLATGLAAISAARQGRPWRAGLLGAACALARPTGILVALPLFDELIARGPWRERRGLAAAAAPWCLPFAGLFAYMAYCRHAFGAWAPFLSRQVGWRGSFSGPWKAFVRYFEAPVLHGAHHSTIDLAFAVLLVAALPLLYLRLRRSYALYATALVLLPLCTTLWSFGRFSATIFPVHMLAAILLARPSRLALYLGVALPIGGFFMALFAAWWWVG